MRDLQSLRREAGRLRTKAGMPLPQSTLDELGTSALYALIKDARRTLQAKQDKADLFVYMHSLLDED